MCYDSNIILDYARNWGHSSQDRFCCVMAYNSISLDYCKYYAIYVVRCV